MEVKEVYEIYNLLEEINSYDYKKRICRNMKKFRLELYNKYKEKHKGVEGTENPYSTDSISNYLNITKVHYKRLESETDENKYISLDNLIKLSYIFNKSLDDFIKE